MTAVELCENRAGLCEHTPLPCVNTPLFSRVMAFVSVKFLLAHMYCTHSFQRSFAITLDCFTHQRLTRPQSSSCCATGARGVMGSEECVFTLKSLICRVATGKRLRAVSTCASRFNVEGDVRTRLLVRLPQLSQSGKRDCS